MVSTGHVMAEAVDTEIVLLVDVSGSINQTNFDLQKDSFAAAFRDNEVMQSIAKGSEGSIAATLVYWAGAGQQHTAVGWMKIDSQTSANQFADAIAATTQPFSGRTALGEAVTYASTLFGTETGSTGNGFESLYQVINVSGNGTDNATSPRRRDRELNVEDARDSAMADGVDLIDGIPIVIDTPSLDQYYTDHLISGDINGVVGKIETVADINDLAPAVKSQILHGISVGELSTESVPEPASSSLIVLGLSGLLLRRARK